MMHWGSWTGFGWGMGVGWIFMLLFWTLLVALAALGVKSAVRAGRGAKCDDPVDILKTRYARGEITKEQFEHMRSDLKAS